MFASYYFKGDYLLCHDDVVDDRKYAFSYYLEDHPSAELVLYDNTATKIEKKISVRKNLLVIFEVSNISYHEVAYTTVDGRKAVTGWLNIKGQGSKR
jgi:Rps23 Pro-64 3,4-dihydroxylase Tpa1-like proline 4-hydroxylase